MPIPSYTLTDNINRSVQDGWKTERETTKANVWIYKDQDEKLRELSDESKSAFLRELLDEKLAEEVE